MKKILILMLAVVLATAMLVSCSDDSAYTEVLESDGAFSYNGKSYGSLEEVIAAISGSKAVAPTTANHTIILTKNVVTRGATIAVDDSIVLDLNGYTMNLEDASDAAITISAGTFCVKNGTVKFNDSSSTANLFKVSGGTIEFQKDAVVTGDIAAESGSNIYSWGNAAFEGDVTLDGNASFSVYSSGETKISTLTLPEGTSLNVNTSVAINEVVGNDGSTETHGTITASSTATITHGDGNASDDLVVSDVLYYSTSGDSSRKYYATIADAIVAGVDKVTQLYDDKENNVISDDIEIVTSKTLTIDSITLSSGKTITLSGEGTVSTVKGSADGTVAITGTTTVSKITGSKATVNVTGTKTAMPTIGNVDAAIFTAEYANINGDVETTGTQSYTNVVFGVEANEASDTAAIVPALTSTATKDAIVITDSTGTVGAVTAESSSVTITDSRKSGNILTTGTLSAETVTITGNEKVMPAIGGVDATSVEATYATIAGDVTTAGTQSYNNAVFKNEDVDLTSNVAVINDVQAAIVITNSTGVVGTIKAEAIESSNSAVSIYIDNSGITKKGNTFEIGALAAYTATTVEDKTTYTYGDITVTGTQDNPVTVGSVVNGDRAGAGNFSAKYGRIAGDVVTEGTQSYTNVEFGVSENDGSLLEVEDSDALVLTSKATEITGDVTAAITITNSTGEVGTIKAEAIESSLGKSIYIDNSGIKEKGNTFEIGALAAYTSKTVDNDTTYTYGNISVTGSEKNLVLVSGDVEALKFDATYATVTGSVTTTEQQLYSNVEFRGSEVAPVLTSEHAVSITASTGKIGSIKTEAEAILINNAKATASLEIAEMTAYTSTTVEDKTTYTYGDITVTGTQDNPVTVGSVVNGDRAGAGNFSAKYGRIAGDVVTEGTQSYTNVEFGVSENDGSLLEVEDSDALVLTSKATEITGDVTAAITITNSTGEVGNIKAEAFEYSEESPFMSIVIDNTKASGALELGILSAYSSTAGENETVYGDISVTGAEKKPVTVAGVFNEEAAGAADFTANYAIVTGSVTTTGAQSYTDVDFNGSENALDLTSTLAELENGVDAAIAITKSTGSVGSIKSAGQTIIIDNSDATASLVIAEMTSSLKTSDPNNTTYGDITVNGSEEYSITIEEVAGCENFIATYTVLDGEVAANLVNVKDSVIRKSVSTKNEQIYTNIKFDGSEITSNDAITLASTGASISLVKVQGVVKNIIAGSTEKTLYPVVIINEELTKGTFDVGSIEGSNVLIESSTTSGCTLTVAGSISGKDSVELHDLSANANAAVGTLFVPSGSITSEKIVIYGGQYGSSDDRVNFSSQPSVYSGTFYIDDNISFKKVVEGISGYNMYNAYPVNIYLLGDVELYGTLTIGGVLSLGDKPVNIYGYGNNADTKRNITIPYNNTNESYPIYIESGAVNLSFLHVVLEKVSESLASPYVYIGSNKPAAIVCNDSKANLTTPNTTITNGVIYKF